MKRASSKLLLLDVNVLVALAWPNHQFHSQAVKRLEARRDHWATCALTELGFIRVSSNAAAVGEPKSPAEAARLLALMVNDPLHVYLGSLPSPLSKRFRAGIEILLGPRQVTDAYWSALGHAHGATLLTFDKRLEALAAPGSNVETLG